jgi:CRP/FNR family transcriptional regulator/CRP/FNR family cyclic AMP-dependent transcriptional regulator
LTIVTTQPYRGAKSEVEARDLLRGVPSLAGLSRDDLLGLAASARRRSYSKGQIIFHRDDPGDSLHIIENGEVRVVLPSPEGEEVTLAVLGAGDFFGEVCLFDGGPRSATAIAATATVTLVVEHGQFVEWLQSRPTAATAVLAAVGRRLRAADELVGALAFLDVHNRLARKLLQLAGPAAEGEQVELRLSQDELASMVGVTRESVNKHLRFFKKHGAIEVHRRRIVLRSLEYLRRYA